jgi:hypothetical protein
MKRRIHRNPLTQAIVAVMRMIGLKRINTIAAVRTRFVTYGSLDDFKAVVKHCRERGAKWESGGIPWELVSPTGCLRIKRIGRKTRIAVFPLPTIEKPPHASSGYKKTFLTTKEFLTRQ